MLKSDYSVNSLSEIKRKEESLTKIFIKIKSLLLQFRMDVSPIASCVKYYMFYIKLGLFVISLWHNSNNP